MSSFEIARACIKRKDHEGLAQLLEAKKDSIDLNAWDSNGDGLLHLAAKLGAADCVSVLMKAGADPQKRNKDGWKAIQEALCSSNRDTVAEVLIGLKRQTALKWKQRLPNLLKALTQAGDYYLEMKWEIESKIIPFVSSFAPSDVYRVWKQGANIRCESSLTGFEGLRMQRGHISFVFEADEDGIDGSLRLIDHERLCYSTAMDDLTDASLTTAYQQADELLRTDAVMTDFDSENIALSVSRGWFGYGYARKETVAGYKADVYDMTGLNMTVVQRSTRKKSKDKRSSDVTGKGDDDDQDNYDVEHINLDQVDVHEGNPNDDAQLTSTTIPDQGDEPSEMPRLAPGKALRLSKHVKISLWLSDEFPIRFDAVLPLLEALAPTSKRLQRLKEVVRDHIPQGLFPVKISIPIIPTINLVATFTRCEYANTPLYYFKTPEWYKKGTPLEGETLVKRNEDKLWYDPPEGYRWQSISPEISQDFGMVIDDDIASDPRLLAEGIIS
eukprot:TRINITY_DN12750_c0_g1::TRINITY_DN12750_c0_g1_i1::g.28725::m.28725 TRINITY_DN12750_c0_g1::TRINITY_DN12750_c0_g1_i1::g.28725  ORF type:complete len:499 (-),score=49.71,sp/Q5F259/AN13B_MOUSE/29.81/2e-48,GPCR_chapero_1/PF11904.3/2.6e-48,Ank_5/PF13857.1/2.2e-09,Ank_2/PF12796.2/4.1e-09,Ank/PF00023.25/1.4e-05,Ank_4/PF13637.1/0.006,Ank_4/PF13637.1/0.061,Ank_3/PF13606.1/0.081,Ank_3/PF13606.1/6.6e+02 TRINITY_DN12750_c0_g1_i1:82-1578(-)